MYGWRQPNVPVISGLDMMRLGMACLYAPIIMVLNLKNHLLLFYIQRELDNYRVSEVLFQERNILKLEFQGAPRPLF